ncbi:MAG: hypothetical protein ACRDSZ_08045 [Pseudonocardiaceae bacterium]
MALLRLICLTVTLGIDCVTLGIGFLSYLWPLWDPKRQTVADKIVDADPGCDRTTPCGRSSATPR